MRISGDIPLTQVPLLHQMGMDLPGVNSRLFPCFKRRNLSQEEENGKILSVLLPGHRIPLYPPTRSRLLSRAR